jgi:hypothetical protein
MLRDHQVKGESVLRDHLESRHRPIGMFYTAFQQSLDFGLHVFPTEAPDQARVDVLRQLCAVKHEVRLARDIEQILHTAFFNEMIGDRRLKLCHGKGCLAEVFGDGVWQLKGIAVLGQNILKLDVQLEHEVDLPVQQEDRVHEERPHMAKSCPKMSDLASFPSQLRKATLS